MIPLADTHVHLLAGLDDGPQTPAVALAMCWTLVNEGVQHATSLAHQNPDYPDNTPGRLIDSTAQLMNELVAKGVPLSVYPTGEIMLSPATFEDWRAGKLLSVGNRGKWLLVEMPHTGFIDVLPLLDALRSFRVRLIIAHAERYSELLEDPALTAKWIAAGCLIQVTSHMLDEPWDSKMEKALKVWATGGFIHMLGSDGHGIERRRPEMTAGFERLVKWIGPAAAQRIGSEWGTAVLKGLPVQVPVPSPPSRSWFTRLFGG